MTSHPVRSLIRQGLFVCAAFGATTAALHAAPPVPHPANSLVVGGEQTDTAGLSGRVAVNVAAGASNQQANLGVVAIGDLAIGGALVGQTQLTGVPGDAAPSSAVIAGDAFAGSTGLISVNVAAGSHNQEANIAVVALGIEGRALTEMMLSQTRASQQPIGETAESSSSGPATELSPDAFRNSSGLVQLNLVGGERNSSGNSFALTMAAGANP